jgi:hypothetical protein
MRNIAHILQSAVVLAILSGCGLKQAHLGHSGYLVVFPAVPSHETRTVKDLTAELFTLEQHGKIYLAAVMKGPRRPHLDDPDVLEIFQRVAPSGMSVQSLADVTLGDLPAKEAWLTGRRTICRQRLAVADHYVIALSVSWPEGAGDLSDAAEFLDSLRQSTPGA